jgi:hypothetical protein
MFGRIHHVGFVLRDLARATEHFGGRVYRPRGEPVTKGHLSASDGLGAHILEAWN